MPPRVSGAYGGGGDLTHPLEPGPRPRVLVRAVVLGLRLGPVPKMPARSAQARPAHFSESDGAARAPSLTRPPAPGPRPSLGV